MNTRQRRSKRIKNAPCFDGRRRVLVDNNKSEQNPRDTGNIRAGGSMFSQVVKELPSPLAIERGVFYA